MKRILILSLMASWMLTLNVNAVMALENLDLREPIPNNNLSSTNNDSDTFKSRYITGTTNRVTIGDIQLGTGNDTLILETPAIYNGNIDNAGILTHPIYIAPPVPPCPSPKKKRNILQKLVFPVRHPLQAGKWCENSGFNGGLCALGALGQCFTPFLIGFFR